VRRRSSSRASAAKERVKCGASTARAALLPSTSFAPARATGGLQRSAGKNGAACRCALATIITVLLLPSPLCAAGGPGRARSTGDDYVCGVRNGKRGGRNHDAQDKSNGGAGGRAGPSLPPPALALRPPFAQRGGRRRRALTSSLSCPSASHLFSPNPLLPSRPSP
jgi:hypothetical protein